MISAAALVNPTITGLDRKFTTTPSRKTPSARRSTPTISANMIESWTKSGVPGVAKGIRAAADIRDSMATGPVWSWLREPHREATMTGMNEA